MNAYLSKLRKSIGHDKIIHPGARIIIENKLGQILIVEKQLDGGIGIPAGSFEENETIEECIIREVKEETGLDIINLEVIGISSNPKNETVQYINGDEVQYFTVEFYCNEWQGEIKIRDTQEIRRAKFVEKDIIKQLHKNEQSAFRSLEYYKKHQKILVK